MSKFYEGIAEIFEIGVEDVNPELDLHSHTWDSLAIILTIALIDDCYNLVVAGEKLSSCKTLADIEQQIEASKRG